MSDAYFPISLASAALGLASVGTLYALHHLKQKIQRRPVATLLFWSQAVRPQQSRMLVSRRFTNRKTFLLLAAILLLLAASITADRWGDVAEAQVDVVVIDAGMETGAMDTSGRSLLQRMAESASLDFVRSARGPAVISAGPRPVLLSPGDGPAVLATRRLATMRPQDGASASSLALLMADGVLADRDGRIHWYTSQGEIPSDLPERVARRTVVHSIPPPNQSVIAGVTFESMPNDAGRGKLHVRVIGNTPEVMPLALKVQTQDTAAGLFSVTSVGGEATVTVDHVVASGQSVTLTLQGASGAAAYHEMTLKMPDRHPLTYRFVGDVPHALKLALLTVGAETNDDSANVDLFVAEQGASIPPEAKASILVANTGVGVSSGVTLDLVNLPITHGLVLEHATAIDGPALPGAGTPLIMAGGLVVAAAEFSTSRPTLLISRALVGPAADLPKHAAFPLLIGRLCDVLTGRASAPALVSQSRAAIDPLWQGPADSPAMVVIPIADRPLYPRGKRSEPVILHHPLPISWTNVLLITATALLVIESLLRVAKKIV